MEETVKKKNKDSFYGKYIKRSFDLIFSILLLIILTPLLLIISVFILLIMGKPVLFKQRRAGKDEKIFTMIKFRTMRSIEENELLSEKDRLTSLGCFLRRSSLDELPELLNIMKGDMSFIGPRPLPEKYLPRYDKFQAQRHLVRPGLSGWAQVNGRNKITWEKKFKYDIEYVQGITFLFDLKIVFLSLVALFRHRDVDESDNSIMNEFKGK